MNFVYVRVLFLDFLSPTGRPSRLTIYTRLFLLNGLGKGLGVGAAEITVTSHQNLLTSLDDTLYLTDAKTY